MNIQVSSESALPLTIIYQTDANATTVRGFYVEVSGADPDATEVSGDFVLPDELLPGANQVYNLDLSLLTAAFYKVGIRSTVGGQRASVCKRGHSAGHAGRVARVHPAEQRYCCGPG